MRSTSEIRLVRATVRVNGRIKRSQWHAIVPGYGGTDIFPGVACSIPLGGDLQFTHYSALPSLDGGADQECMDKAAEFVGSISSGTPAFQPEPEPEQYGRPDNDFQPGIVRVGSEPTDA